MKNIDLKTICSNILPDSLKLQKEDIEYGNLPNDLKASFNAHYILSIFIFSISIIIGISVKDIAVFSVFTFISLTFALINTYRIMQTLSGNILCLEGECVEVNYVKLGGRLLSYKRSTLTMQVFNDSEKEKSIYVVITIPDKSFFRSYKKGNIIRAYIAKTSLFKANEDTYKTNSNYYMYCIKSNVKLNDNEKESK